jgi:competence ComEA-like helix-hairpin-helix protein
VVDARPLSRLHYSKDQVIKLPSSPRIFRPAWLVTCAAILLAATIAATAAPPQDARNGKAASPALTRSVGDLTPEEEEDFVKTTEATLERVCVACHPFENIVKTRRTVPEWNDQVTNMAMRGAPGSETDFALVKKYLARYYGVIRVNSATAEDLSAVLGLSSKTAAAVVEYRKANGKFTDLASLTKVDGVDKAKLEENADALRFD